MSEKSSLGLGPRGALCAAILVAGALVAPARAASDGEQTHTARSLLPLTPREGTYVIRQEGEKRSQRMPFRFREREDGRWVTEKQGWAEHVFSVGEDGAIRITAETDHREELRIAYEDPVLLLPGEFQLPVKRSGKTPVTVYHRDSGRVKDRGSCVWRLGARRWHEVETPAGRFEALRVVLVREMDLGIPQVRVRVAFDFAPGVGQVRAAVRREVEALFFFGSEKNWVEALKTSPSSRPASEEGAAG